MCTITEDYVSFETAKLLKEKGFHEKVNHVYHYYTSAPFYRRHLCDFNGEDYKNLRHEHYSAPTLQMAMKWLREVHNIKVNVFYNNSNYAIEYFESNTQTCVDESVFIGDGYDVYEEACEVAIKYCLKNLI